MASHPLSPSIIIQLKLNQPETSGQDSSQVELKKYRLGRTRYNQRKLREKKNCGSALSCGDAQ